MIGERELLTDDEITALRAYKGMKPFLAVCWALDHVRKQQEALLGADSSALELVLWQYREVAFKFRGHCGQILNLLKQPVPFPYFHLLNVRSSASRARAWHAHGPSRAARHARPADPCTCIACIHAAAWPSGTAP